MNSINTTIISDTFNKKDLEELLNNEIKDTYVELEYNGPTFDKNNMNKETETILNAIDNIFLSK